MSLVDLLKRMYGDKEVEEESPDIKKKEEHMKVCQKCQKYFDNIAY